MRRTAVVAAAGLMAAAAGCGSSDGPGKPYGVREVETTFHEHHVATGRFGDMTAGVTKADLRRGTVVGLSLGNHVQVAVFSTAAAASGRARWGKELDKESLKMGMAPAPEPLKRANVVVQVLDPAQTDRVRAALADLGR